MSNVIRTAKPPGPSLGSWSIPVVAALAGFALGAGLAGLFGALHGNWERLPLVDHGSTSTVPYWTVQFLGPALVSICWTGLLLHARRVGGWQGWTAAALVVDLALLVAGLLPIALAGNGGVAVGSFGQLALALAIVAIPLTAIFLPPGKGLAHRVGHGVAAVLFAVALWLGQSIWASQTLLI